MNASIETLPATTNNTKPLWAAVGILGVAVLSMGGGLIYTQTRPPAQPPAVVAMAPAMTTQTSSAVTPAPVPAVEASKQDDLVVAPPKPPVVVVKPKPKPKPIHPAPVPGAAPAITAAAGPAPLATQSAGVAVASASATTSGVPSVITENAPVVSQPVARPVCINCGTIESVTPVERQGTGSGTGAVAGGVLGAVVGNQIGHGGGRTAATLLGALGGGFAGNAIEKHVKKETVYQVRVRMQDGSTRTVEQASLPAVGTRVTVDNGVLHSPSGG